MATNGFDLRGLSECTVRATSSLPVPLSPVISTEAVLGETISMSRKTSCMRFEGPTSEPRTSDVAQFAAADFQLALGTAQARGVLQDIAQPGGIDGLLDEVEGAALHGGDGGVDAALRGQQNDGDLLRLRGDILEQLHAVHARHAQIGDDDAGIPHLHRLQTFDAVAGGFGFVTPGADQFRQARSLVLFVLDNQNFFLRHGERLARSTV